MSVSNGPNLGVMINALTGDNFDAAFRKFLREIDGLVMASVISRALSAPPGSPANGDRYIVGASPTGAWASQANAIARWTTDDPAAPSGEWEFFTPKTGWTVFSVADSAFYEFTGSAWASAGGGLTPPVTITGTVVGSVPLTVVGASGQTADIFDVEASGGVTARFPAGGGLVLMQAAPAVAAGQVSYGATTAATATAGAQILPANPTGFLIINVAGTAQKIPYYNA
ncbi:MAG: DUF2793 domain-containing protein [Candidatus Acidiferrales bacterium]